MHPLDRITDKGRVVLATARLLPDRKRGGGEVREQQKDWQQSDRPRTNLQRGESF